MARTKKTNRSVRGISGTVRKILRNSDGSRTVLMSQKGTMGIKIWYPKKGAPIATARMRMKK